ncbi:MAG: hypothetical protein WAK13_15880, partial [Terriglobales bacterium]
VRLIGVWDTIFGILAFCMDVKVAGGGSPTLAGCGKSRYWAIVVASAAKAVFKAMQISQR